MPNTFTKTFNIGSVARMEVSIILAHTGQPITGLTPYATITRQSDDYMFDYSDKLFKVSPVNPHVPLIEDLPSNTGNYYFLFDQTLYDTDHAEVYNVVFTAYHYLEIAEEDYIFEAKAFALPIAGAINRIRITGEIRKN